MLRFFSFNKYWIASRFIWEVILTGADNVGNTVFIDICLSEEFSKSLDRYASL